VAIEVELRHPRSAELVAARDTLSVVPATGSREREDVGSASLHVSVTYDSVTANYRYSYFLRNRSAGETRVIAFALLGASDQVFTAPDPRFTSWQPPEWQGNWTLQTECGERRDALVWMIWNADPRTGSQFDFALAPDRLFEPAVLRSRFPPGKIRWAVQTATGRDSESALVPCRPGAKTRWETLPLTGTTVGPVAK